MKTILVACLALAVSVCPAQNLLTDPGFENGDFSGWTGVFGNAFVEPSTTSPANTGNFSCKMFGNFSGGFDVTGVFEEFPCAAGEIFELDCFSRHNTNDAILGVGPPNDNWAVMKIAFFDSMGMEIPSAASEAIIIDGTSPLDTWIDNTPIQGTAPMGAVTVQALILFLQPLDAGGALFCDDVSFTLVPAGPQCSSLSVSGTLSPGATITASVTGTLPDTLTFLAIGQNLGTTSFSFGPLGGFDLDLAVPFIPFPMGLSDSTGAASVSISIPANFPPAALPASLSFQAVSLDLTLGMGPPSLNSCVSNLVTL